MTSGISKIYALAIVLGEMCGCALEASRIENSSPTNHSEREAVLTCAMRFSGLSLAPAKPYVAQTSSHGRGVWQVTFDLHSQVPDDSSFEWLRSVIVLLETNTLHLISIRFQQQARLNQSPSSALAHAEAKARGELSPGQSASTFPAVTFLSALNSINEAGYGDPHVAKEISGVLGLVSAHGSEKRPVWLITLVGLPPGVHAVGQFEGKADAIRGFENQLRNPLTVFVDAITRECLFAVRYSK